MKKFFIYILTTCFIYQGCSNFEEINVDPNNPPTVPTELLLSPIISKAVSTMTASGRRAGQYVQHLAYIGGTSESDGRFNLDGAAWREEWNGALRVTKDINQMIKLSQEQNLPQYEALAYINKVYILSLVTDAFGDIPYDEVGMGNQEGLEFAKYQGQEEVFERMLADLEKANALLTDLPSNATITRDILYNGNSALWRKFANSLKLRILMRQSGKKNVATDIAEIFNNPSKYPIFSEISDQATLTYNNSTDFYSWYIQNPAADGSGVNFGDNARISEVLMELLNSGEDPRLTIYASPTRNSFNANKSDSNVELVYRGQIAGMSEKEQKDYYTKTDLNDGDFSVVGRRITQDNRAFLMTYAELLLIKAEAIERNFGVQGDVKEIYKQAVDASFAKWPQVGSQSQRDNPYIDENMKTAYWAKVSNQYNSANGLKMIYEQFYIDSYLNGFEGWATWRRTGVPSIKPGPSVLAIPVRYVYSDNEQNNPSLLEWVKDHMDGNMPNQNVKVWFQP